MSTAYWLRGDTRTVLAELAATGIVVDLVVTSPPFLALRSYLPAGDPAKAFEIGGEANPGEFIDTLLDITEGCERVLAPHGSLCVELGDTRAGSGGSGGDYDAGGLREGQAKWMGTARSAREDSARMPWKGERAGWPTAKSHCMVPELYRVALTYGFNPLTGRTTPRWRVRNTVTWCRPNPSPGADGDKFRTATSDIAIACRTDEAGRCRYWDGDAVRTLNPRLDETAGSLNRGHPGHHTEGEPFPQNVAGAPLLDWWKIAGSGYEGAHYATWPPTLVVPLIKAMCPERVCRVCGEPSRRLVRIEYVEVPDRNIRSDDTRRYGSIDGKRHNDHRATDHETVGWTDCGHNAWRPGIVLDPFAGSGTTLAVATGHGRDAIGIDLDARNIDLARDRVGPLFFHETTVAELAGLLEVAHSSDRGAA